MTRSPVLLGALALAAIPVPAQAITCSVVSVSGVSMGAYDVFSGTAVDSTGSIVVNCTGVLEADTIIIDLSAGGAASFAPRRMSRGGGGTLDYNLYRDAARTTVWGDGSAGTSRHGPTNPPEATNVNLTVYGRVPALQDVQAGSYSDTVVVTINY